MRRFVVWPIALLLVLAGCGGATDAEDAVASLSGVSSSVADDVAAADVDQEAAMLALTECLRENGVDIADPTVDADGNVQLGQSDVGDGETGGPEPGGGVLREAFETCGDLLEGVALGFGQLDQTEFQDTLLEFASCMRDNGVDMPDPDFSSGGPGDGDGEGQPGEGGPFGAVDLDDPVFQAAQEACGDILAWFGPGGGRFGGGPGGGGDDD